MKINFSTEKLVDVIFLFIHWITIAFILTHLQQSGNLEMSRGFYIIIMISIPVSAIYSFFKIMGSTETLPVVTTTVIMIMLGALVLASVLMVNEFFSLDISLAEILVDAFVIFVLLNLCVIPASLDTTSRK